MRISYWLSDTSPLQGDLSRGGAQSRTAPPPPRSPCCCCFRACPLARPPAMASLKDLEGRWRLTESQGFEEYMKELGEDTPPKPRVLTRVLASPSTTRPGELRGAPRGC